MWAVGGGGGEESQERVHEPALPHRPEALEDGLGFPVWWEGAEPLVGCFDSRERVAQDPGGLGHMGW